MADHYTTLGVTRTATPTDIRSAFRRLAKQFHPDVVKSLPVEDQKKSMERMKEINIAWETLSDPEKRSTYDALNAQRGERERTEATRPSSPNPRPTQTPPRQQEGQKARQPTYDDIFNSIFGSAFRGGPAWDNMFSDFSFGFKQPPAKTISTVLLPDNDWGLLAALRQAYLSKGDGKWKVKKSNEEKREGVPDILYQVIREGEHVRIWRTVKDWRASWDKDSPIKIRKEGNFFEYDEYRPESLFGEYYLYGPGHLNMNDAYAMPSGLQKYYNALRNLAWKLVNTQQKDGGWMVAEELAEINRYTQYFSKSRTEGGVWETDTTREWAHSTHVSEFWTRLQAAEGYVSQVEGTKNSPEGSPRSKRV